MPLHEKYDYDKYDQYSPLFPSFFKAYWLLSYCHLYQPSASAPQLYSYWLTLEKNENNSYPAIGES